MENNTSEDLLFNICGQKKTQKAGDRALLYTAAILARDQVADPKVRDLVADLVANPNELVANLVADPGLRPNLRPDASMEIGHHTQNLVSAI